MPVFWSFLVLLVPTGLAVMLFTTTANSATQLGTAAAVRGRVMGLYMLVFLGGAPLGSPMVGWVAEQFGARMSLIAGGMISAVAAVGVALVQIGTEQRILLAGRLGRLDRADQVGIVAQDATLARAGHLDDRSVERHSADRAEDVDRSWRRGPVAHGNSVPSGTKIARRAEEIGQLASVTSSL